MRILLIGDYSNMHSQLARTLRSLGHSVTLLSDGSGFQRTDRDIDVSRRLPWKFGGAELYLRCRHMFRKSLHGFDIVAFQHPNFLTLKPIHLQSLLHILRNENDRLFLTAAGTDVNYIRECLDPDSPLRYNEFRIGALPGPSAGALRQWMTPEMEAYNDLFYTQIDGAVSALYEYHIALRRILPAGKIHYGGIPVDVDALAPYPFPDPAQGIHLFLGRHAHRRAEKGTDILEQAARDVCRRHSGVTLEIVENRPYAEYVTLMKNSHIVLDQLYSFTPATNALIAMSRGRIAVSGAEPEYYDFIGETTNRPIVNVGPGLRSTIDALDALVADPDTLAARATASRTFATTHNAATTVATRFLHAWTH